MSGTLSFSFDTEFNVLNRYANNDLKFLNVYSVLTKFDFWAKIERFLINSLANVLRNLVNILITNFAEGNILLEHYYIHIQKENAITSEEASRLLPQFLRMRKKIKHIYFKFEQIGFLESDHLEKELTALYLLSGKVETKLRGFRNKISTSTDEDLLNSMTGLSRKAIAEHL